MLIIYTNLSMKDLVSFWTLNQLYITKMSCELTSLVIRKKVSQGILKEAANGQAVKTTHFPETEYVQLLVLRGLKKEKMRLLNSATVL